MKMDKESPCSILLSQICGWVRAPCGKAMPVYYYKTPETMQELAESLLMPPLFQCRWVLLSQSGVGPVNGVVRPSHSNAPIYSWIRWGYDVRLENQDASGVNTKPPFIPYQIVEGTNKFIICESFSVTN